MKQIEIVERLHNIVNIHRDCQANVQAGTQSSCSVVLSLEHLADMISASALQMDDPKDLHTSYEWLKLQKDMIILLDPDGWDRTRYSESMNELITEEEFKRRLDRSTVTRRSPR